MSKLNPSEIYELLKDNCDLYFKEARSCFINSPSHKEAKENLKTAQEKLGKFEEEFPEVLL